MGRVWEAYHKGVPLLGVPGITLDCKATRVAHVEEENGQPGAEACGRMLMNDAMLLYLDVPLEVLGKG